MAMLKKDASSFIDEYKSTHKLFKNTELLDEESFKQLLEVLTAPENLSAKIWAEYFLGVRDFRAKDPKENDQPHPFHPLLLRNEDAISLTECLKKSV